MEAAIANVADARSPFTLLLPYRYLPTAHFLYQVKVAVNTSLSISGKVLCEFIGNLSLFQFERIVSTKSTIIFVSLRFLVEQKTFRSDRALTVCTHALLFPPTFYETFHIIWH